MSKLFINTDGGSRGNPGPAAIGVVIFDENESILYEHKETIGFATNNEAEYKAIIKAFELLLKSKWLKSNADNGSEVICRLDSQLVVEQICGRYKAKKDHICGLLSEVQKLINNVGGIKVSFVHVMREQNKDADRLVNEALDEQKTSN